MQSKGQYPLQIGRRIGAVSAAAVSGIVLVLSGCSSGLGSAAFNPPPSVPAAMSGMHGQVHGGQQRAGLSTDSHTGGMHGQVHGGQQPISGATIQLYAVGTSGSGSAATPLLTGAPTMTDANGNFQVAPLPTCSSPNEMLYITAMGGNPGLGGSVNNTAATLMVGLGSCAAALTNPAPININEVNTVASVYALSGFITSYTNVGYASGSLNGITQAFATQNLLANPSSGTAPGVTPPSGITFPTPPINSLANSISACVNSTGSSSTGCSQLFTAATPSGGSAPSNTIDALVNIAHNPGRSVSQIYNLAPTTAPPFGPILGTAPMDWSLPISYTGGGLALPNGIALDASGNAWVANEGGNAVTEISNGTFLSGTTGYTSAAIVGAQGIAVDTTGNVWLANTGGNSVLKLSPTGAIASTLTSGVSGPVSIALDSSSNVWVANFDGNSVAEFSAAGSPASGSPFTNAALVAPTGLAIDSSNNVWVGSSVPGTVALFNNSGVFQNVYTDGLLIATGGIATDSAHSRIWTAATGIGALTGLTPAGATVAGGPFVGGGIAQPLSIAVDGAGTVWTVSNQTSGSVAGFTSAGVAITPAAGLGSLNLPVNLALDQAGDLWTTNAGNNSVTEFVGLAAPTITPLVASAR